MRQKNVPHFTENDREFANLLIEIGTKKNIAKMLAFLASTPEATPRAIEHGIDMRRPEISRATKSLVELGWIRSRKSSSENEGRQKRIYELAKPITEIMDYIENEKREETDNQLALVRKLREYLN